MSEENEIETWLTSNMFECHNISKITGVSKNKFFDFEKDLNPEFIDVETVEELTIKPKEYRIKLKDGTEIICDTIMV